MRQRNCSAGAKTVNNINFLRRCDYWFCNLSGSREVQWSDLPPPFVFAVGIHACTSPEVHLAALPRQLLASGAYGKYWVFVLLPEMISFRVLSLSAERRNIRRMDG